MYRCVIIQIAVQLLINRLESIFTPYTLCSQTCTYLPAGLPKLLSDWSKACKLSLWFLPLQYCSRMPEHLHTRNQSYYRFMAVSCRMLFCTMMIIWMTLLMASWIPCHVRGCSSQVMKWKMIKDHIYSLWQRNFHSYMLCDASRP